jgi:lysine-specific permease
MYERLELQEKNLEESKIDLSHRRLQARHLEMIAIGGAIGSGLFIGSGKVIQEAGPIGALLAYIFAGIIVYFVVTSMGELCTFYSGSFPSYASRFVDEALGFSIGVNYWLIYACTLPAELVACTKIIQYWWPHIPAWSIILTVLLLITFINVCGVEWFGEVEFALSMVKVLALLAFMVLALVVLFRDQVGFQNYQTGDGPMGPSGILGFFSVISTAFFAFTGTELVGVTAREAENPFETVPKAIKSTFWRITFFYTFTIFLLGLLVPQTHPSLALKGVGASPFVIALDGVGFFGAADLINSIIFFAVLSAANSCLYATSRTLHSLAIAGHVPRMFLQLRKDGTPLYQLIVSVVFGCIAFLYTVPGGNILLEVLLSLVGTQAMLTYLLICYIHLRFRRAWALQGRKISELPYTAPFVPFGQRFTMFAIIVMMVCIGITPFFLKRKVELGVVLLGYSGVPVYIVTYFGYKLWYGTKTVDLQNCDLDSDRL